MNDNTTQDIITQAVSNWGVSSRQAYRYLWAANRFFEEKDKLKLEYKKAYYIARKKKLLRDMDPKEKKTAAGVAAVNRVLDSMAKLEGVSVDTLKVIGDPNNPLHTVNETYSTESVDYSKLPTEFLEFMLKSRKAS